MKGVMHLEGDDKTAWETVDKYTLQLSLKLIRSPYLEKRLKGLADIKERIRDFESSQRPFCWKYYTPERLLAWMKEVSLLSLLLNEDTHAEIIKRLAPILSFFASHKSMSAEVLDRLWGCQLNKHEDMARVVYDVLASIVIHLPWTVLCVEKLCS